ncbi:hypothetical protein HII36_46710 [Nonomuraea sp. NN258]|nr:hypothetical protein [Nonomuraea antri]
MDGPVRGPGVGVLAPGPMIGPGEPDREALPELAACLAVAAAATVRGAAPTNSNVAHRLCALAGWLAEHGRAEEAVAPAAEAVVRLRGLAAEEPGLRLALASAAGLLSTLHARLDDLDPATRAAAESVRNLRTLAALDPAEHRPALAERLLELGELLLLDARPGQALDPLRQAVVLTAHLNAGAPEPHARARRLLGLCLDELGRHHDARVHLEAAAERYDALGAADEHYLRHGRETRARLRDEPEPPRPGALTLLSLIPAARPDETPARAEQSLAVHREIVENTAEPSPQEIHDYVSAQAHLARVWAGAGRASDGFALAMQAAELLRRHALPEHGFVLGTVAAALGRTLVGLGRPAEALPHLFAAVESREQSQAHLPELAELLLLESVALSNAGRLPEAEDAAERLVELHAQLVSQRRESPEALAGALRVQGGIRFARRNVKAALESVTRALDVLPPVPGAVQHLLTATCLELAGLCHAELNDADRARAELAKGVALLEDLIREHGPAAPDLTGVHVLALLRLGRLRVDGPPFYAQILQVTPLPAPDVLTGLVEELAAHVTTSGGAEVAAHVSTAGGTEPAARVSTSGGAEVAALLPPLAAFAESLAREVPVSVRPGVHERFGRCLRSCAEAAARAGDGESAARAAALAAEVFGDLAAADPAAYRVPLGLALRALFDATSAADAPDLAVLEQAIDLLDGQGPALAETLNEHAAALLAAHRPVEALAQCERAADLCDELDDPALAAVTYARLGATLAVLDRPQAALEAVTWSLAEQDRARESGAGDALLPVRATAIRVRGQVLRAFGRRQEALAHLVEALQIHRTLGDQGAAAEIAGVIADDLLATGRAEQAIGYARAAADAHPPATLKWALATQRLVRCHMVLGELTEAHQLADNLIELARRSPDDLTYRAILADSLAQSSELLPLLLLDDGAEAESRAREAIAIYDELLGTGVDTPGQQALHTSRAGAGLTLAAALRMRDLAADAVQPLREAVATLERFAPGNPPLSGHLSRAMLMLGDALMDADRALEASIVFHRGTQVIEDRFSSAVAHAQLGFCQQELGRGEAADTALREAESRLRDLLAHDEHAGDDDLTDLLCEVLRARLKLLKDAGGEAEMERIEDELTRLTRR